MPSSLRSSSFPEGNLYLPKGSKEQMFLIFCLHGVSKFKGLPLQVNIVLKLYIFNDEFIVDIKLWKILKHYADVTSVFQEQLCTHTRRLVIFK